MGLFKPSRLAHAHCHVPCGIYDPVFAINAAETVAKMVDQLLAMEVPAPDASSAEKIKFHHDLERRVVNKEEHAKKCKYELLDVLWTQYFKPEHLERWPDLHEKFHRAGHLCTQNMQNIDAGLAQELWDLTKEIGAIFAASKS
jgi:nickel superoxide dismutase